MSGQAEYYDVFISYSHADRAWVRGELLLRLEAAGLQVCIDFRDFKPGAPSVTEMERAVVSSRKTLLILTPAYLESTWAEFEQLMLQTLDPANRERRLIPVLKAKCDLPPRIRYLTYVDFAEPENRDIAWAQLLTALGAPSVQEPLIRPVPDSRPRYRREDWGQAIDVSVFYGRRRELANLKRWIVDDQCRLVAVLGIGGIGKSALAKKVAEQIRDQFDYLFWRDLRNAPPLDDVLRDCIKFLSDQREADLPESVDSKVLSLIEYLRKHHCLLVLDNVEAILRGGHRAGLYREGYEDYELLIQRVGETAHQSCLVLTSREKPREVALLEGRTSPVRSLQLGGLGQRDGRKILRDKGLRGTKEALARLVHHYVGNPLVLKIVAESIQESFGGDVAKFLDQGIAVFGDIRDVLDEQFDRLSEREKEAIYWLAIEREAVSLEDLLEDIVGLVSKGRLLAALGSLQRRSLIETSAARSTLQPVILEYMIDRVIEQVYEEINAEAIALLMSHALIKAQARDYVRNSQVRLILKPVADRLLATLGKKLVEDKLTRILSKLREEYPLAPGYAAGNVVNVLVQLRSDISGYDFSHLVVRQAYLRGADFHDVSFAYSDLANCVFTENFSSILSVAFSPNGRLLAVGSGRGEILVWQVADGKELLRRKGHTSWVWSVTFSPDGHILASGSTDQTVKLWDVTSGRCLKTLRGHTNRVRSVAFPLC